MSAAASHDAELADFTAALEAELDARPASPPPLSARGEAARDAALHIDLVVDVIFSMFPAAHAPSLARVCEAWREVAERRARAAARALLRPLVGLARARELEAALFAGAPGVGARNAALRRAAAALRRNADVCARVASGALAVRDFLCAPADELATPADRAFVKRVREEELAAARAPRAAVRVDVRGTYQCRRCGATDQAALRVMRAGTADTSRYTERLVCCECRAEVFRHDVVDARATA
jgi:hypothetical protein